MNNKYLDIITATSVKKYRKKKNIESFTVLQLRVNRFHVLEVYAAIFDNAACATSNILTKLPGLKWKKDATFTQKIFQKAEELFAEADKIVCGFADKDIRGYAFAYRQFRGTYINESHIRYDEIFDGKEIEELLVGDKNARDIISEDFSVTEDMAENLAAIIMDDSGRYTYDGFGDDLIRASMFLLEETARRGYNPEEVLEAILSFHEMEVGCEEVAPVYLRKDVETVAAI